MPPGALNIRRMELISGEPSGEACAAGGGDGQAPPGHRNPSEDTSRTPEALSLGNPHEKPSVFRCFPASWCCWSFCSSTARRSCASAAEKAACCSWTRARRRSRSPMAPRPWFGSRPLPPSPMPPVSASSASITPPSCPNPGERPPASGFSTAESARASLCASCFCPPFWESPRGRSPDPAKQSSAGVRISLSLWAKKHTRRLQSVPSVHICVRYRDGWSQHSNTPCAKWQESPRLQNPFRKSGHAAPV
mmetsp:Transcript_17056/g.40683  ORF Transcript_17056/g.40683 Transcript_17056/m.40683 type:complete len:249 (+) Transcript_17056:995-1741(+)